MASSSNPVFSLNASAGVNATETTLTRLSANDLATTETVLGSIPLMLHAMPEAPRVSLLAKLPGGNLADTIPGQIDLIDRLLMKGTRSKDAEQIAVAIDDNGLDLDIDTGRDVTTVGLTCLPEDLEVGLKLMAELVFDSTLKEASKELSQWEGELAMDLDSPKARAADLLSNLLYPETSAYGVSNTRLLQAIPKLRDSLSSMEQHYRLVYQPERLKITVAGPVQTPQLKALLENVLSPYQPSNPSSHNLESSLESKRQAVRGLSIGEPISQGIAWPGANQSHIFRSWMLPSLKHPDGIPMLVLNTLLGGAGLSARLFTELRDKQGLAYNVRSSLDGALEQARFTLYIGTDPKNTGKCLKGFQEQIDRLYQEPIPAWELDEIKRNLLGRRAIQLETAHQWVAYLAGNALLGRTLEETAAIPEKIAAVTAEDVARVAQTYLTRPSVIAMAGPQEAIEPHVDRFETVQVG
jgi:zinc protease